MPNRSHFNPAHRMMNRLRRDGLKHSSEVDWKVPETTYHIARVADAVELLRKLPDGSV